MSEVQDATGVTTGSKGSGGTIRFNPNKTSGGLDTEGGTNRPAYVGLGHELGHAVDANQGALHFEDNYTGISTGVTYEAQLEGLHKREWRAVYIENKIRQEAGLPLRTHYGIDMSSGRPLPTGPRLLSPANNPINYFK